MANRDHELEQKEQVIYNVKNVILKNFIMANYFNNIYRTFMGTLLQRQTQYFLLLQPKKMHCGRSSLFQRMSENGFNLAQTSCV